MQGQEFSHEKLTGLRIPDNNRSTNISLSLSLALSQFLSALPFSVFSALSIIMFSPLETGDNDDAVCLLPCQLFLVGVDADDVVVVPESIPMMKL